MTHEIAGSAPPALAARAPVITIDGPTASGKGTIAQRLASQLGFACLDSGALYRIVGLLALERGIALDAPAGLVELAASITPVFDAGRILLDGRDIAAALRAEPVGTAASRVAAVRPVRAALLDLQRRQRRLPGLVADGRDMGTVVFPDARLKVFLIADVRVRAERRLKQLLDNGLTAKLSALSRDIVERDERDRIRDCAPLAPAADARVLDSSALTVEQVLARILSWYPRQAEG